MTNYQNDIMDLLKGETPREKHNYLINILSQLHYKGWTTIEELPPIEVDVLICIKNKDGRFNYMVAFLDENEEWIYSGDEDELGLVPDYWSFIEKPQQ